MDNAGRQGSNLETHYKKACIRRDKTFLCFTASIKRIPLGGTGTEPGMGSPH